ncbi:MAG: sugar phosphate nucleotidyltransferase [Flavobacteriaceae bacterium]
MKIIVPMAGRGSRLRPHSLTVPKPLIPVAGVPIVEQLVTEIARVVEAPIEEIAFILGDPAFFDSAVETYLTGVAEKLGARASIYRQLEPLGTGHAIMCAESSLEGPAVVAYADTLIRADLQLDPEADAVIWVKQVDRPEAYGVVQLNEAGEIVELVEKPQEFVSDQAVIGIYYFKDIGGLRAALKEVIAKQLKTGKEYQINDGIKALMAQGKRFVSGAVREWLDCGNPKITLETNRRMLELLTEEGHSLQAEDTVLENSRIIPPCYIGPGVVIKNSTVGPFVSLGRRTQLNNVQIQDSLVQNHSQLEDAQLQNAMIGNHVHYRGERPELISIGDYTTIA